MIQSLIINNNGTIHEAKDVFQEAMIVLYDKARSETFELNCQIKTYVYSVCRRLWLKRLQQLNRYSNEMETELSSEERKYFFYAGKFAIYMQSLRFMTDYLNNDAYYGAKYHNHNHVRAQNQFALLEQFTKNLRL